MYYILQFNISNYKNAYTLTVSFMEMSYINKARPSCAKNKLIKPFTNI